MMFVAYVCICLESVPCVCTDTGSVPVPAESAANVGKEDTERQSPNSL